MLIYILSNSLFTFIFTCKRNFIGFFERKKYSQSVHSLHSQHTPSLNLKIIHMRLLFSRADSHCMCEVTEKMWWTFFCCKLLLVWWSHLVINRLNFYFEHILYSWSGWNEQRDEKSVLYGCMVCKESKSITWLLLWVKNLILFFLSSHYYHHVYKLY